jgi:SAM-dependent methyltransferase
MSSTQTPLYSRILQAVVRPFPNFDFGFIQPVRAKAVELLRLSAGARVVDAGCGSGGSFSHLVRAVGKTGEVVGIEISPGAVEQARRRVETNKWSNVRVELAPAQSVALSGRFEGLLMFAAPDVFASPEALRNLIPGLQDRARVVLFGAKRSTRPLGWLLNRPLHFALTRLSLPTTPGLEAEPWQCAAYHLRDLEVLEYFHGWMFLAAGTLERRS